MNGALFRNPALWLALAVQAAGIIYWGAGITAKVTALDDTLPARVKILEIITGAQNVDITRRLDRIELKLDALGLPR